MTTDTPEAIWARVAPDLTYLTETYPSETIALVEAHWDAVRPRLLQALQAVADDPSCGGDGDTQLHLYAMYLLAKHREPAAFAPLLRLLELPRHDLDWLLGDVLTEGLGICLASTATGEADHAALRAAALNDTFDEFARAAALTALLTRVMEGDLDLATHRAWLVQTGEREAARLRADLEADSSFLSLLVGDLSDLGAGPVLDTIRGWYAEGLIDELHIDQPYVEERAWLDFDTLREQARHEHYVRDLKRETAWWFYPRHDYRYAEADVLSQPYRRETPKIGRNEPCPCGSGRKYKKCCGAPR